MKQTVAVLTALIALALGGCANSSQSEGGTVANAEAKLSPEVIAAEAGFRPKSGYRPNAAAAFIGPGGCEIAVILNSAALIKLYAGAGDTVVTDPTHSIGAKIADDPRCIKLVGQALLGVELNGG